MIGDTFCVFRENKNVVIFRVSVVRGLFLIKVKSMSGVNTAEVYLLLTIGSKRC